MKDIAIYLACVGKLSRMTVHLNGGAGMRELLHPSRKILRALNRFFLRRVRRVIVLGPRLVDIFEGIVPRDRIATAANSPRVNFSSRMNLLSESFRKLALSGCCS